MENRHGRDIRVLSLGVSTRRTTSKQTTLKGEHWFSIEFLCREDWEDIHQQGEEASAQGMNTQVYEDVSGREREKNTG